MQRGTYAMLDFLDTAKIAAMPAKYVVFDS